MKRAFLFVITLVLVLFAHQMAPTVEAVCSIDRGSRNNPVTVTLNGNELDISGQKFPVPDSRCTPAGRQPNGVYTLWCDDESETRAYDSVLAPICGGSQELGKANSSCWSCGSTIRCAGLDFALGETSQDLLTNKGKVVASDDESQMERVWVAQGAGDTFTFNGHEYTKDGKNVIVCTSNVLGCGATDTSCSSILHPEITSENEQSQARNNNLGEGVGGRPKVLYSYPALNVGQPVTLENRPLQFLSAIIPKFGESIFARIRYGQDIFESMAQPFRRIGNEMEGSASQPLMPSQLQAELNFPDSGTKPEQFPLKGMSGYRLCLPSGNEIEGTNKDNIPLTGLTATQQNIGFSDEVNPRYWSQMLWSSNWQSMVWGPAIAGTDYTTPYGDMVSYSVQEEEDGNRFLATNVEQLERVLFPCDATSNGVPLPQVITQGEGEARTGGAGGFVASLVANFFPNFFSLTDCTEGSTQQCANAIIELVATDSWPGLPAIKSQFIGIIQRELGNSIPLQHREQIARDGGGTLAAENGQEGMGGFLRGLLPDVLAQKIGSENALVLQGQSLVNSQGGRPDQNRNAYIPWANSIIETYGCGIDNMSVPSQVQKDRGTQVCKLVDAEPFPGTPDRAIASWAGQNQILNPAFQIPLTQQDVHEAIEEATEGRIPACVLEGVKYIESGSGWQPTGTCTINQCSAAGPFQITTGYAPDPNSPSGFDANCKRCGPSWADGSRSCPDGWPGNWPIDQSATSPCDVATAAPQAVNMLIAKSEYWTKAVLGQSRPLNATASIQSQRDSIMLASDSYWGVTAPVARLGGCTYGEFVYKHCDPTYQCGNPPVSLP